VQPEDIKIGPEKAVVKSTESGKIKHIDNKTISRIARVAGAPKDKRAGLYLHAKIGNEVQEGDALFTIYSENKGKLEEALKTAKKIKAIELGGVILEEIE